MASNSIFLFQHYKRNILLFVRRSGGGDTAEDLLKLEMKLQQEKEMKELHLSNSSLVISIIHKSKIYVYVLVWFI
jgi:aspartate carbamoyltransferase regulatory subunit